MNAFLVYNKAVERLLLLKASHAWSRRYRYWLKKFNFVKKLKNFYIFMNENAPSYAFLLNFYLENTLFSESKIEEKNDRDNAKVDKVGGRTVTEGAFCSC